MPHSSPQQRSPSTVNVMLNGQTKKIAVSSVKNQDISHDIALTLGSTHVSYVVTSSWTIHTEYLLQDLRQLTTNNMEVTMPDQVWGTTMKIEKDKVDPDHILTMESITV